MIMCDDDVEVRFVWDRFFFAFDWRRGSHSFAVCCCRFGVFFIFLLAARLPRSHRTKMYTYMWYGHVGICGFTIRIRSTEDINSFFRFGRYPTSRTTQKNSIIFSAANIWFQNNNGWRLREKIKCILVRTASSSICKKKKDKLWVF